MSKLKANKIIKAINRAITLNPTTISFVKIIKNEADGAFKEEIFTNTIIVLIYIDDSIQSVNITSEKQGTSYVSNRYRMIADKDANLDTTPTETIDFISNGDKFKVKAVFPQIVEDIVCGYICDLERID